MRISLLQLPLLLTGVLVSAQNGPETVIRGAVPFQKRVVVSGLAGPWEITWGPDSKLWVTERTGKRITRVDPVSGARQVLVTIDDVVAPGGQDGLLGMALHPELLKGTGNDYVYVFYTYVDQAKGADPSVADVTSPYRYLYGKLVRFTYDATAGKLGSPQVVLAGLPAGNDHVAGRVKIGPDRKLYLTLGDQGNNQLGNFCLPAESQRIPTAAEMAAKDFVSYVGKSLRMNLDGSVPKDNPKIKGVVSHVLTYGHRNPQGLDFGPDGTLYSSEQGPKTDDEVNILKAGGNYGWPNVAGMRDDKAYEYARWAEAKTPCKQLKFSDLAIEPTVPRAPETAFKEKMVSPLATLFTVPTGFNFHDPACKGIDYICWPTVAVSSVEHFQSKELGRVLLVPTLKRGSLYVVPLTADGKRAAGYISRYFQSENRYRDTAVSPDGKTIFVATDPGGLAEAADGGVTRTMLDSGAILAFTVGGNGGAPVVSEAKKGPAAVVAKEVMQGGVAPQFTAAQVAAGKTAYESNCAVCHGSTLTNGTFGTPLGGEYFQRMWSGRSVGALLEKSVKTMPPAAPGSLKPGVYADVVAYVLEMNGAKAGSVALGAAAAGGMRIP